MELMEIILLIAGGIIFVLSFFIPDKGEMGTGISKEAAQEEIRKMVEQEMEAIRGHVEDVVEESITYSMEKTERSLERLSNEKIMAVSEYSNTVLAEIHKNHEEAMFLYDMLNSKHNTIKDTVSEVNRTMREAEETVSGIKKAMPAGPETSEQESAVLTVDKTAEKAGSAKREGSKKARTKAESTIETFEPLASGFAREEMPVAIDFGQDADGIGQNSNEKILELYRQGKSTVAIAKELGLGVGEVKLVIGLYKNQ